MTAAKLHAEGIRTIGELSRREEAEVTTAVGKAAGRHLWALANLIDPRPVEVGRRRRSIGSQSAMGRPAARTHDDSTPCSPGSSTGSPGGCAAGSGSARRSRSGCASTTSPGRPARRRCPTRPRRRRPGSRPGAGCSPAWPLIEERGCTLLGITISGLVDGRLPSSSSCRCCRRSRTSSLDGALDRVRDKFGSDVRHPGRPGRAAHRSRDADAPRPRSAGPTLTGVPSLPPSTLPGSFGRSRPRVATSTSTCPTRG